MYSYRKYKKVQLVELLKTKAGRPVEESDNETEPESEPSKKKPKTAEKDTSLVTRLIEAVSEKAPDWSGVFCVDYVKQRKPGEGVENFKYQTERTGGCFLLDLTVFV